MSQIEPLNLLLPHIYIHLIDRKDIHSFLSLAATCKDFHRRYKESSISNYVDSLKQLYQNIQIAWEQRDVDCYHRIPDAVFTFKNEKLHIYPSITSRMYTSVNLTNIVNGEAEIAFNVSVEDGRLQSHDLTDLKHLILVPSLLKKELYSQTLEFMFQIEYFIDILKWEWSMKMENQMYTYTYTLCDTQTDE
jgi:hypothetical protein